MAKMLMPFVALVQLIITHIRPHLDEIAAWWLAVRYGLSFFPGLDTATLVLWNAGNRTPDGRTPRQWKEKDGALLFGVGGAKTEENPDGAEFDEHGLLRKTCTFVLMLEALGLTLDPRFRELYKFTLSNDREGNSSTWDAARILKSLNAHTVSTLELAKIYFAILDAHINRTTQNDPEWTGYKHAGLFDGQLAQWLWEKFAGKARDTVERPATAREVIEFLRIGSRADLSVIKRLAERDHTKGATGLFDIVTMFSELVDYGVDAEYQKYYVYVILDAYFAKQLRFIEAANEVATKTRVTWIGDAASIARLQKPREVQDPVITRQIAELEQSEAAKDADTLALIAELRAALTKAPVIRPGDNIFTDHMDGINPFKVVTVETDNEEALNVLRGDHSDAQFYLRRQTSNHTVINGPKHLMDSVCVEVRSYEYMLLAGSPALKALKEVSPDQLRKAGNIPEEPAWCYHLEGGQLLNGALTSPGDPCTLQSVETLEKRIARGVRQAAIADPRRICIGGILPRRRPSGKPQPSKVPAPPRVPQAPGNGKDRKGGHQRGRDRNRGRRSQQAPKPAASSSGGFDNKPFASIAPVATPDSPNKVEE